MIQGDLMARLVAQAGGNDAGAALTLRALVEEASEAGAQRALENLGLGDPGARTDMDSLRLLLAAWRDAKRAARRALVEWLVRLGLAALLIGLAIRLGLAGMVRN
jgi:hypothetical protein